MRDYELMVVLRPTVSDEEIPAALETVSGSITAHGGEPGEPNVEAPWGRRRLAYPIDDQTDGFYALFQFKLDPSKAAEVDRDLKLNEQVLRFLVTRPDA